MTNTVVRSKAGSGKVNVGTIGHIDHGKSNLTALILRCMNSSTPELPECYLQPVNNQPYYRRFEKKPK